MAFVLSFRFCRYEPERLHGQPEGALERDVEREDHAGLRGRPLYRVQGRGTFVARPKTATNGMSTIAGSGGNGSSA